MKWVVFFSEILDTLCSRTLVDIAGHRIVKSGNLLTNGEASDDRKAETLQRSWIEASATQKGKRPGVALNIPRAHYAELFGPTTGDVVTLGDTSLKLKVEKGLHLVWR